MSGNYTIVRLLEIPERKAVKWKAGGKAADEADDDVAFAFEQFTEMLEDPGAYGVRRFPYRGMTLYLFIGNSWDDDDPTASVDVLWEAGVLDALGLDLVVTAVD